MTCFALNRIAFALVLSLGFAPAPVQARQLEQPTSVLPWAEVQPEVQLALRPPTSIEPERLPTWLLDPVKKPAAPLVDAEALPMVETEEFVDLGALDAEPTQPRSESPNRGNLKHGSAGGPLNFFKALGIQATRPSNRN